MAKINFQNKSYLAAVTIVFAVFVACLFYSYIYKLGWQPLATYSLIYIIPILLFLNFFANIKKGNPWFYLTLCLIFSYVLTDKVLRLHIIIASALPLANIGSSKIIVELTYIILFAIVMSLFWRFLFSEMMKCPDWVILFGFAFLVKCLAIFADFLYHNRLEDYIELFALYFFAAAFVLSLVNKVKK